MGKENHKRENLFQMIFSRQKVTEKKNSKKRDKNLDKRRGGGGKRGGGAHPSSSLDCVYQPLPRTHTHR